MHTEEEPQVPEQVLVAASGLDLAAAWYLCPSEKFYLASTPSSEGRVHLNCTEVFDSMNFALFGLVDDHAVLGFGRLA